MPILLVFLFLLSSCRSINVFEAQMNIEDSFEKQDYIRTISLIDGFQKSNVYRERDEVLRLLEMGTAQRFAGQWTESTRTFQDAELKIELLYGTSVSRNIAAFLVNDYRLEYEGEDYEDVYLNAFNSLNYIHLNELESALVEARRIAFKLDKFAARHEEVMREMARKDTTGNRAPTSVGTSSIQNSAFGHFLASVLFAASNRPDNARIEYNRMTGAFMNQGIAYQGGSSKTLEHIQHGNYNTLLVAFSGRSPSKRSHEVRTYIEDLDFYIKFSFPVLETFNSRVGSVEAVINDTLTLSLPLIENMSDVAEAVYKVKEPLIYFRTFTRSFLRALSTRKAQQMATAEGGETLGRIVGGLGMIGTEAMEMADLRRWTTLPGQVYGNVLDLPAGEHRVRYRYYTSTDRLIYETEQIVQVGEKLTLTESIYYN